MKWNAFILITIISNLVTSLVSVGWNRRKENKQDRKLYIWLMLGGFIWSQLQTEYLIWRIKKDTEQTVGNNNT